MSGLGSSFASIRESHGPLCVGIDPSRESLISWGLPDNADGARELSLAVVHAASGRVGIVKPQIAYFERFGAAGLQVVEQVLEEAHAHDLATIADVKRGDIGSTMAGYAEAWLGDGPLGSDAMTVTPYQGFDSLEPAFDLAERRGSTVFVLCATSNPDASSVQSARVDGRSLPSEIARSARRRNGEGHSVGVVVGATRPLAASGLEERDLEGLVVLAPGFGAQGAALGDVTAIFGANSPWVVPSVSRSVLRDGPSGVSRLIDAHNAELGV